MQLAPSVWPWNCLEGEGPRRQASVVGLVLLQRRSEGRGGHPPDHGLVLQVPDHDVAVAAAGKADLGVGADGQGVAGRGRGGQLGLDARGGRRQVPDGQGAGLPSHDQTAAVRQQLAGTDVVVPVLGRERSDGVELALPDGASPPPPPRRGLPPPPPPRAPPSARRPPARPRSPRAPPPAARKSRPCGQAPPPPAGPALTRQSSCATGVLAPGCPTSHTLTQPLPPVYTCCVEPLMVTAQTTSPCASVCSCRACRGMPAPTSASEGKGTGCICPSADTWKE